LLALRDAADEGDGDGDARRGRHDVVAGEAGHLGEIAHGGLAAVVLPVGVGRERHGRVEREVGRDRPKPLRVERQHVLDALHDVQHQQRHEAEHQDRDGVLRPAHLVGLADAGRPVDETLEGSDDRIEKRALAREDARHEGAERRRHRQHGAEEEQNLQPANRGHQNFSGFNVTTTR
jgi:hypothetical protein